MQWPAVEPGEGRIVGERWEWWRSPELPVREEQPQSHLPQQALRGDGGEPVLAVSG